MNYSAYAYPLVREAASEIVEGGCVEAILAGAVGIGKTTLAVIVNIYYLYLLSLERHPQIRYGLDPYTMIIFAILNRTVTLARDLKSSES